MKEHLARRKEIYLEMHPETKTGGSPGDKGGGRGKAPIKNEKISSLIPSFAQDAAKKAGKTARNIQQHIKVYNDLDPEVPPSPPTRTGKPDWPRSMRTSNEVS